MKRELVDMMIRTLGLPPTGMRLARQIGMGIADQIADELIKQKKGAQLLKHLENFALADIAQFKKGYLIGVVEGLVSPVTDLFGILVFGERINYLMKEMAVSAFNNRHQVGAELQAVVDEVVEVRKRLGDFGRDVRKNPEQALLALLSAPEALSEFAEQKAYEVGKAGGASIVAGLEAPWKKAEEAPAPSFQELPAAATEDLFKQGEEYFVNTPWAKVGNKVGYALGFVAIQAVMIALSYGIGNLVAETGAALGRIGSALGKLSAGAGAVATRLAEFVTTIGKGIAAVEAALMLLVSKVFQPLEKFLGPILTPIKSLFEKLQKFLKKLFGVAEKDGAALLDAAASKGAKSLAGEKVLPKPPPEHRRRSSPA